MKVIGDLHSLRKILLLIDQKKYVNENIIQVGDFGIGFQETARDIHDLLLIDEALMETGNHLYVCRGNHDNPLYFNKFSGLNLPKFHNLHLMEDYSVERIEDKNVLFIGGGISIDRSLRENDTPYPTWWKDEKFFLDKEKLSHVNSTATSIDIVITHSAPGFCYPVGVDAPIVDHYHSLEKAIGRDLKKELLEERADITELHDILTKELNFQIKEWCYGHFHGEKHQEINGIKFNLLNINQIYEIT